MVTLATLAEGQIVTGPLFNEPMRVVIVRPNGTASIEVGLEGMETSSFRRVSLTSDDIANLRITDPHPTYDGDGNLLRLGLQAYSMGIAHEFDPYFGLSISRVDPLPHQLEAVYEYFMKLPSVRFLLADDAGAGKTIMAAPVAHYLGALDRRRWLSRTARLSEIPSCLRTIATVGQTGLVSRILPTSSEFPALEALTSAHRPIPFRLFYLV